jgi:hypothetical protein
MDMDMDINMPHGQGYTEQIWIWIWTWTLGSSDFDKIFENCFASSSFELAKDI